MIYENFLKDLFESKPDYRKIVLLIHLIQKADNFLKDCGFLKSDSIRLNNEYKTILVEQNEE